MALAKTLMFSDKIPDVTEATQNDEATTSPLGAVALQPLLHDLASCVAAPGVLLTGLDGQLRPGRCEWLVRR